MVRWTASPALNGEWVMPDGSRFYLAEFPFEGVVKSFDVISLKPSRISTERILREGEQVSSMVPTDVSHAIGVFEDYEREEKQKRELKSRSS